MLTRNPWIRVVAVVAILAFGPGLLHLLHVSWQQRVADRKLRKLEAAHRALVSEQERLTNDPVYVEELARSTFKVSKPGELVVPIDSARAERRTR